MKTLLHLKQKGLHLYAALVKGNSANLFVRTSIDVPNLFKQLMPLTGTIGLEPISTALETAALPIKLCSINSRKPVEKRERKFTSLL